MWRTSPILIFPHDLGHFQIAAILNELKQDHCLVPPSDESACALGWSGVRRLGVRLNRLAASSSSKGHFLGCRLAVMICDQMARSHNQARMGRRLA
jgi:hypothetical protein